MTKRKKIVPRHVNVGAGLTRAAAKRAALRRSPGDFRGFIYESKTGKAWLL